MAHPRRLVSALGGRRTILVLGSLYVVVALGRAAVQLSLGISPITVLVVTLFVGGSGVVLLVGGLRLPTTDISPAFYHVVGGWCLAGIGVMLVILGLYHVQPDTGLSEPGRSIPILTGFSAVAGFGVGLYAAQAKTRALELERQNRRLQRMQSRLEASNDRLEQFASIASHDLQEPLRMVSSYLRLIEQRRGDDLDEETGEFLEYAVDGAERMRAMIDGLLAYSRVETRGDSLEPVDLEAVLADVLRDLELRIDETDAEVTVDALPHVEGDPNQLRQLFQNLVSNALAYSGDEPPIVHISAESDAGEWVVSVSDAGVGIAPEDRDRIFELFERLHGDETCDGSGIGLAVCQRIVERHGGEIRVDSELGEGSTFSFVLPAVGTDRDPLAPGEARSV
jgi:two-component system, chemotaxis family, sensor kinase Cph1